MTLPLKVQMKKLTQAGSKIINNNSTVIGICIFVIVVKLALLLTGAFAFSYLPFAKTIYQSNFHYPTKESSYLLPFKTWDGAHYLYLAQKGYNTGQESNRFFPLYPALIVLVNFILHNVLVAAYFVSTLISLGCAILLYLLTLHLTKKREVAILSVVFLMSFPSAFFLSLVYSEGLYLFLSLLFFYLMEKNSIRLSLIPAILLPLTRPTGIFILFPMFFFILSKKKNKRQFKIPTFNRPIHVNFSPLYLMLCAPFLGVLIYFILMYIFLGNAFGGITGLSQVSNWNIVNILDPLSLLKTMLATHLSLHGFQNSLLDRSFFVLFVISLPFLYRKTSKAYFYFTLSLGLVPLFGSFTSYLRYLLPAFPLYILLAEYLLPEKRSLYRYSFIAIFLILQSIFFAMQILNYWVA